MKETSLPRSCRRRRAGYEGDGGFLTSRLGYYLLPTPHTRLQRVGNWVRSCHGKCATYVFVICDSHTLSELRYLGI